MGTDYASFTFLRDNGIVLSHYSRQSGGSVISNRKFSVPSIGKPAARSAVPDSLHHYLLA